MILLSTLALVPALALAHERSHRDLPAIPAPEARELRAEITRAIGSSAEKDWTRCLAKARSLEAKYALESLLAVLAQGPERERGLPKARKVGKKKEELQSFGSVTVGYAFEVDGQVYRYAVDVPSAYDGSKPFALLIDPGHGSGADEDDAGKADFLPFYRGQVDAAGLADWLVARTEIVEQVGAGGKLGAKPEDEVARIFAAFRRDVVTRFHVDLERIYVAGLSQTGFWSWYVGRELADRLAGIAPMSAVTWGVDPALENLLHLPAFVIHGARDEICAVAQPRATTQRMKALGLDVQYLELADSAHDVGVWSRLGQGLTWLAERPRTRDPARVVKILGTLENPWAHWLRVDRLAEATTGQAKARPTASVRGRIDGQRVELTSEGVRALSLWLTRERVDLAQEVEVVWNGRTVQRRVPEPSFSVALEAALERCDWATLPAARIELR
jgi:predicted esterase